MKYLHGFNPLKLAAVFLPLLLGVVLACLAPPPAGGGLGMTLTSIHATEAAALEAVFDELNYMWPPSQPEPGAVPPLAVRAMPTDLATLDVDRRKSIFFRILAPLVAAENRKLREQREFLLATFDDYPTLPPSGPIASRVQSIASRFNVAGDLDRRNNRELLLRRVDTVPAALVLAQAANESGWGTSRFVREANNVFGMWTWDRKSGLLPKRRNEDATHFIRVFDNLQAAVNNYLHTINIGPAYRELRELRELERRNNREPDAMMLAAGLRRYSARGEEYVQEIRSMIEYNRLQQLPVLNLDSPAGVPPARPL